MLNPRVELAPNSDLSYRERVKALVLEGRANKYTLLGGALSFGLTAGIAVSIVEGRPIRAVLYTVGTLGSLATGEGADDFRQREISRREDAEYDALPTMDDLRRFDTPQFQVKPLQKGTREAYHAEMSSDPSRQ